MRRCASWACPELLRRHLLDHLLGGHGFLGIGENLRRRIQSAELLFGRGLLVEVFVIVVVLAHFDPVLRQLFVGLRGPNRTPTDVLRLRGSRKAQRRMNEPRPPVKIPKPPSWLEKDAKSCWKKILPRLKEMRVLRQIDENALARYCTTWVRWRRACAFLEKRGETYMLKDDKGNPKRVMPFPEVAIANKLGTELLRLEQQFGMTPASRPNLEFAPPPYDSNNPYSLVSPDDPYSLSVPRVKKRQPY